MERCCYDLSSGLTTNFPRRVADRGTRIISIGILGDIR